MKRATRVLGCLLVLSLVVGLVPATATAATAQRPAIQLVDAEKNPTGGIVGWTNEDGYDYIYYGTWNNSAIKWRVLDDQTNTGATGLFLLSDVLLGTGTYGGVYFDNVSPYSNAWQGSSAQAWCKDFAGEEGAAANVDNAFTSGELNAVLDTTKTDSAFTSSDYGYEFSSSQNILDGDKVFFLSASEAENATYGFTNKDARKANYGLSAGVWWLRSPFANDHSGSGVVFDDGAVTASTSTTTGRLGPLLI